MRLWLMVLVAVLTQCGCVREVPSMPPIVGHVDRYGKTTPRTRSGFNGVALYFNGDAYLDVEPMECYNIGGDELSIELWILPDVSWPSGATLISKPAYADAWDSGDESMYRFKRMTNTAKIRFEYTFWEDCSRRSGLGTRASCKVGLVSDWCKADQIDIQNSDGWVHVGLTFQRNPSTNQATVKIFKNGLLSTICLKTDVTAPIWKNSDTRFFAGAGHFLNNEVMEPYKGSLDEIRVWNYTRSEAELGAYYNYMYDGNTPGLVLNFGANEGVGVVTYDDAWCNASGWFPPNHPPEWVGGPVVVSSEDPLVVLDPASGTVSENGLQFTFNVKLNQGSNSDVTVPIVCTDAADAVPSPSVLTFTDGSYTIPQVITVSGIQDYTADGNKIAFCDVGSVTSTTAEWEGVGSSNNVTVTVLDSGLIVLGWTPANVTETPSDPANTATFTVVLSAVTPSNDVVIPLAVSDTSEGLIKKDGVSIASLTFTNANWNVPQTVTIYGVDDAQTDGDMPLSITMGAASSSEPLYNGLLSSTPSVDLFTIDDDLAAVITTQGFPSTTEGGTTSTFSVALQSKPNAVVTVAVSSSDPSEGSIVETLLTFTPTDWDAQVVTITGENDDVQDGNQPYNIIVGASVSDDPAYNAIIATGAGPTLAYTNMDDDVAGVSIAAISGNTVQESSPLAVLTFTVELDSEPTDTVEINVVSSDDGEAVVVTTTPLVFTAGDWDTPQTVTIRGVDESVADGDQAVTITVEDSVSVSDPTYGAGITSSPTSSLVVTNIDDDSAGVTVAAISGTTSENLDWATFTITLTSEPSAGTVVINLGGVDTTEGDLSPTSLTFSSADWNDQKVVNISGVDDDVQDGDITWSVSVSNAVAPGTEYDNRAPSSSSVSVTNLDNDVAAIAVSGISGLATTEDGTTTATFTVVLSSEPTVDVDVPVTALPGTEGSVAAVPGGLPLTFTSATWDVPQTVTVTGVDEQINDGPQAFTVSIGPGSSPGEASVTSYHTMAASTTSFVLTNADDDVAAVDVSALLGGTFIAELGTTATHFTVVLRSEPTADVHVGVTSGDTTEGVVTAKNPLPALPLIFTSGNWNVPQTVIITAVDELVDDDDQTFLVTVEDASSSGESSVVSYDTLSPTYASALSVTTLDDDVAAIIVSQHTSPLVTTEAGIIEDFSVVLGSEPSYGTVFVSVTSGDLTEGTVSVGSLTFTTGNWNVAQSVNVTGANDDVQDGDIFYAVTVGNGVADDPTYSNRPPTSTVSMRNDDDDIAEILVTSPSGPTSELGASCTFTVSLATKPLSSVSVSVASNDLSEGSVSTNSLSWTPAGWASVRTVTVAGVNDDVVDGDVVFTVTLGTGSSLDGNYVIAPSSPGPVLSITNTDDDARGITVSALTPADGVTHENGPTSATFTVVLDSKPVGSVIVPLSVDLPAEAAISPASLTFDATDWDTPQTVTVTAIDDAVDDGDAAVAITVGDADAAGTDAAYVNTTPVPNTLSITVVDNDIVGLMLSSPSPATTVDDGQTATFTVVLKSKPLTDVVFNLAATPDEGVPNPLSLTFTSGDWNVPQTVTVTGQVATAPSPGPDPYTVELTLTGCAGNAYCGLSAPQGSVTLTNLDSTAPAFIVSPASGNTGEPNFETNFTIVLSTAPSADVILPLSSSDTAEGAPTVAGVTFTSGDWNLPHTVTLRGADDAIDDGPQPFTVELGVATGDGAYAGLDPEDFIVINEDDDDTAGIIVTASPLTIHELGTTSDTFTAVLSSEPTSSVTVDVATGDATEGQLTGGVTALTLTFSPASWNISQTITVTAVDEAYDDDDVTFNINIARGASLDPGYSNLLPSQSAVGVTTVDDDVRGISLSAAGGLVTDESGVEATFTVVLDSRPTANVKVYLSSSNSAEGIADAALLTFTSGDWDTPQTVTVTGQDDDVADGPVSYDINVGGPTVSGDAKYNGIVDQTVGLINGDNDTVAILITHDVTMVTDEGGASVNVYVVLASEPTADVVVTVSSSSSEGAVVPSTLTFKPGTWDTIQPVVVTGQDDDVADGPQGFAVIVSSASSPGEASQPTSYHALAPTGSPVAVTNNDDDDASIVVSNVFPSTTTEAGGTSTMTIVLTSEPVANVTIPVTGHAEGAVGATPPLPLVFTSSTWNVPQTVTITGVDDDVDDGDQPYTVTIGPDTSTADMGYLNLAPTATSRALINIDNDVAGVTLGPLSSSFTTEAGGNVTFTVVLDTQPTATVDIPVVSSLPAEGMPFSSPALPLVFTAGNWNLPRTVTVAGQDDEVDDGHQPYTIAVGSCDSADLKYGGNFAQNLALSNRDNDESRVTASAPSSSTTSENGVSIATFTVVLSSSPTLPVDVPVSVNVPAEGEAEASPALPLTFTAANWNVPQTVTIRGVDELIDDGNQPFTVTVGPADAPGEGGMPAPSASYHGLAVTGGVIAFTNVDDDFASVVVSPVVPSFTTEAGSTASFTVSLSSEPIGAVYIPLSSSDPTEGNPATDGVTFTSANWSTAFVVVVTGEDDALDDGDVAYTIRVGANVVAPSDPPYDLLDPNIGVSLTSIDNDGVGINLSPSSLPPTTEAGSGSPTPLSVTLGSQPTNDVEVWISTDRPQEAMLSSAPPLPLTFTSGNWNIIQTVTVTGVDDPNADGDRAYTVFINGTASLDPQYDDLTSPTSPFAPIGGLNIDDDLPAILVVGGPLVLHELNTTSGTFVVSLLSSPLDPNVLVPMASGDASEFRLSVSTLTFGPGDWSVPQTVTVTAVNDYIDDTDFTSVVSVGPAIAISADYDGRVATPSSVAVTTIAAPVSQVLVSPSGTATSESGTTIEFVAVLSVEPSAPVTVPLLSTNPAEANFQSAITGGGAPVPLVFTPSDWDVPQTATLVGLADGSTDGDKDFIARFGPTTSPSIPYSGILHDFPVTNEDIDLAGLIVTPPSANVTTEWGVNVTFSVSLAAAPSSSVRIPVESLDTSEGLIATATGLGETYLTFSVENYNVPQTVTVVGIPDFVHDSDVSYVVLVGPVISSDVAIAGLSYNFSLTNVNQWIPEITLVNPAVDYLDGGRTVAITGRYFREGAVVTIGVLCNVTYVSSTELRVISPGADVESTYVNVEVRNPEGGHDVLTEPECMFYTDDCPFPGWFGRGTDCIPCPTGGVCPGGYRIYPQPGFWNKGILSGGVFPCPPIAKIRCAGGWNSSCGAAYTDDFCGSCELGYYVEGDYCLLCEDGYEDFPFGVVAVYACLLMFLVGVTFFGSSKSVHLMGFFIINLQYIMSVGAMARPETPVLMRYVFMNFGATSFSLDLLKPGCTLGNSSFPLVYYTSIAMYGAIVVLILIGLAVMTVLQLKFKWGRDIVLDKNTKAQIRHVARLRLLRSLTIVGCVGYFSVTEMSLRVVNCVTTPFGKYVRSDASLKCYTGTHTPLHIVALCVLVVFSFGFIVASVVRQFRQREDILRTNVKELIRVRRENALLKDSIFAMQATEFQAEEKWWFFAFFLFHMLFLAFVAEFTSAFPVAQLMLTLCLLLGSLFIGVWKRPYLASWRNRINEATLAFCTVMAVFNYLVTPSVGLKESDLILMSYVLLCLMCCLLVFMFFMTFKSVKKTVVDGEDDGDGEGAVYDEDANVDQTNADAIDKLLSGDPNAATMSTRLQSSQMDDDMDFVLAPQRLRGLQQGDAEYYSYSEYTPHSDAESVLRTEFDTQGESNRDGESDEIQKTLAEYQSASRNLSGALVAERQAQHAKRAEKLEAKREANLRRTGTPSSARGRKRGDVASEVDQYENLVAPYADHAVEEEMERQRTVISAKRQRRASVLSASFASGTAKKYSSNNNNNNNNNKDDSVNELPSINQRQGRPRRLSSVSSRRDWVFNEGDSYASSYYSSLDN